MANLPKISPDKIPNFLIYVKNRDNDDKYLEIGILNLLIYIYITLLLLKITEMNFIVI